MLKMYYSGDSGNNEDIYMVFLLPRERNGLEEMIKNLNGEELLKLIGTGEETKVDVGFVKNLY